MTQKTMQLAILLLASLALNCARTSAGRPAQPSNVRQFDRLPNLAEALNVAKSPYEPVTLANSLPVNVARTSEEPMATTTNKLTFEGENLRTTRSAEQPEDERTEQASSSTAKSLDDGAGSSGEASSTQMSDESTSQTEAPQAETSPISEVETERVGTDELQATTTSTTTTPEPASTEGASPATQEPSETTTEADVTSSASTEETSSSGSVAPEEQPEEVTTTSERETTTTTAAPETTTTPTTTTAAPETTPLSPTTTTTTTTETPTTNSPEFTTTPSGSSDAAETDQPKEQPELTTTTASPTPDLSQTSSEPPSSTELATEAPPSSSTADVEREQQQPTTTTTTPAPETTTEAAPSSSQSPVSSTEAPKLEGPKPRDEDKSLCDHLPTYDSDEIQKVFREETTYRNGTIKGKFTYINFDQRYRLVHYTRLPYGPVKIDRVDELGKPGQSGSSGSQTSSSTGDVLQLRNLLPNSLFGFPFLGPHAINRPQAPSFANRNDDPNAYFYSTDSLSPVLNPNPLDSRSYTSSPRSRPHEHLVGPQLIAAAAAHRDDHKTLEASNPHQPPQETYSKQLNRLEGPSELSPFLPVARTGHQFQYSSPFQPPNSGGSPDTNSKGFSYSYFSTSHSDYQPVSHHQPWASQTSSIYPAYPLRIGHQLSDYHESQQSRGHHQPHGHEHYVAPFMFARPVSEKVEPAAASSNSDSRLKLQVKTSKSLNLNSGPGQTKSAQLRQQPSNGHYSRLSSPSQMYQRNQQQRQRLGKQSQQRHRSLVSPTNEAPVVYHVLTSPYNRRQFHQGHVMAYDQADK